MPDQRYNTGSGTTATPEAVEALRRERDDLVDELADTRADLERVQLALGVIAEGRWATPNHKFGDGEPYSQGMQGARCLAWDALGGRTALMRIYGSNVGPDPRLVIDTPLVS